MRITEIELQYEDIMWFGMDCKKHIFECTSAGYGNVPEFVCKSKENLDVLVHFFMNELEESTSEKMCVQGKPGNELYEDCALLARKGIYCFDVCEDENRGEQYIKIAEPIRPLSYDTLPQQIQEILCECKIDVEVAETDDIYVQHAYK